MFYLDGSIYLTIQNAPVGAIAANTEYFVQMAHHGEKGAAGEKGAKGDPGQAASIRVGTVTAGNPDDPATVVNVGTDQDVILNITIPRGQQGLAGSGAGDMLASTYDTNSNGVVDNAEKLDGHPAGDFSLADHDHGGQYAPKGHDHDGAYLREHPAVTPSSDTSNTATPASGETFTVIDAMVKDANGHVTSVNVKTVKLPEGGGAHPTGDGNLHVPATGTMNNGNLLQAGTTAGSASWQPPSVHGAHLPPRETVNNKRFLRNDGTWQDVTPANIGALADPGTYGKIPARYLTLEHIRIGSPSYKISAGHDRMQLQCTHDIQTLIIVPKAAYGQFPDDMKLEIVQFGDGNVIVSGETDVQLLSYRDGVNGNEGGRILAGKYAIAVLEHIETNVWLLSGDLGGS